MTAMPAGIESETKPAYCNFQAQNRAVGHAAAINAAHRELVLA